VYGEEKFAPTAKNLYKGIETLALNLLSTELKMRTCERHGTKAVAFNDNVQAVRTNIPHLLQDVEAIVTCSMNKAHKQLVIAMQTRCYWLAATFHVWWSRNTTDLCDVKELGVLSLEFIDNCIQTLQAASLKTMTSVLTPHLRSHGRVGNHWSELSIQSLSAYRNLIESSTVISRVRQRYQDILMKIEKEGINNISEFPEGALNSIENDLFDRYNLRENTRGEKFDELISDFIDKYRLNLAAKSELGGSKDAMDRSTPVLGRLMGSNTIGRFVVSADCRYYGPNIDHGCNPLLSRKTYPVCIESWRAFVQSYCHRLREMIKAT
jgi:hypothetical protein